MKKQIMVMLLVCLTVAGYSQVKVKQDSKGNYVPYIVKVNGKNDTLPTGRTFVDRKGTMYPVYESVNHKLYIWRDSKNGNRYKQYLDDKSGTPVNPH